MSERDEFEPAITETEAFLHSDGTWDGEQCHGTSGYLGVPFIRADIAAERERKLVELLRIAQCPNYNCDNEGTLTETVMGRDGYPEPQPAPCQWCHERDEALAAHNTTKVSHE